MSDSFNRRQFLGVASAGAAAIALGSAGRAKAETQAAASPAVGPNEAIRVACIGVRGKGNHHMAGLESAAGADVVALCDIDDSVLAERAGQHEQRTGRKLKRFTDYRQLLDDPEIDAVSVATPNHTHTLIALAAIEAGKDVYVEKPCSHNLWEGRQLVRAARKHGRMVQHGTQGRSSPAIREAVEKLRQGVIGEVYMARGLCFKWRPTIGRTPDEPVPAGVNYDLWLGPARERPFSRNRFHYNWHWNWDYGNGDLGNQGVHEMDMARWGLGVGLPTKVHAAGGHFMFDDDQETPNTLVSTFEYPEQKKLLVFEVRHWITNHEDYGSGASNAVGVTFFGSEGYMQVEYFRYRTFLGQKREPGPSAEGAPNEYERFIAAVRSRRSEDLGVDIEEGHLSSSLCHLGNISYRLGRSLEFDPAQETFKGDAEADRLLRREYRAPYVVREIV